MTRALSDSQQILWDNYRGAESLGTRSDMLQTLNLFIAELQLASKETWKPWALGLAAQIVDDGADIPVRHALFERILFPALVEGLNERLPGSARWLAGLSQHLYRCSTCAMQLGVERATEWALLREAMTEDPEDHRSRQRLIKVIANQLRHTLHEVPSGVLYGMDGATVSQCDELVLELEEFRSLVTAEGCAADYAQLVSECDFHFTAYKKYLLDRPSYENYDSFLQQHGRSRL
jgi:hypothetical protein